MILMFDLLGFDPTVGYIGLFTISFIASVIPFIPVPFFIFLLIMGADPSFDPNILALSSTIGSTIGKVIIFYASYYGRNALSNDSKIKMKPLQNVVRRYGWIAAFIAAATPVPDDLVYIPLGLSKYNPLYFIISTFGGKATLSEIIVWSGKFGLEDFIKPLLNDTQSILILYITAIILAIILAIIIYFMTRLEWSKYIGKIFPWALDDEKDDKSS